MASKSRINNQWKEITKYFEKRPDYQPFKYGKNIRLRVEDEEIKILSKRDLINKQEYIINKYGPEAKQLIYFVLDINSIFDVVEKRVSELLKETDSEY